MIAVLGMARLAHGGVGPYRSGKNHCPYARLMLKQHTREAAQWAHKLGQVWRPVNGSGPRATCAQVRRASGRAARARVALRSRWNYLYAWWTWLPDKWQRLGRCETGLRFDWTQPSYISSFGIYRGTWYTFGGSTWTGRNTPREQYAVALRIHARYGYGAWGCGGV